MLLCSHTLAYSTSDLLEVCDPQMMRGDRDSEEEEPELTPKMSHSKVHCVIDHVK